MRIGFIGLGNMGGPIARNLLRAGHTLVVYNRTPGKSADLAGAAVAESAAGAARDAEILMTMLSDDAALEQVIFGNNSDGAIRSLPKSAIHVSMSTISVELAGRLAAAHAQAGQQYVSAPVFGRPQAAAQAGLWVVAGGDSKAIDRCRPIFEVIGRGVTVVGDTPGMANTVKLAGNFMIASSLETLGEALALVRKQGVATGHFLEIINGLFRSPVYEIYSRLIADQQFEPPGFRLRLGLKDVRLALAAADALEVPMPLGSLLHDRLMAGLGRGLGELDWSSIAALIAEDSGLESRK